ncbi:MAG TPA: NADH oxidase, partial [Eubacteriaceae bacterium]|nr:NADH oxidase [Eubacteriaceae bacterium]
MPHITCLRNPALGREADMKLVPAEHPKKVLIAGGGIAGMEAALTLKKRGHQPVLFEKDGALGGQFWLAGKAPRKGEMQEAMEEMARRTVQEGVEVRLNTVLSKETIEAEKPDEVIVAVGARSIELGIEGAELGHVTNGWEVLRENVKPEGNIVVIGGGLVGLEVAEFLAEKDHEVSVVEMLDEVGKDLGQLRKIAVMESLYHNQIKSYVNSECLAIKKDRLIIKTGEETQELKADYVVVAVGAKSEEAKDIEEYCKDANIPYHRIGDALKARRAINATAEAAK